MVDYGALGVAAAAAITSASVWLTGAATVLVGVRVLSRIGARNRPVANVQSDDETISLTIKDIRRAKLFATGTEIGLQVAHPLADVTLMGNEAIISLARWLPWIRSVGFSRDDVRRAAEGLEAKGSSKLYFEDMAVSYLVSPKYHQQLSQLTPLSCLTLEMAATGRIESGTSAMDLALLERAWRDAEEIAAIADSLGLATSLEGLLTKLRGSGI